MIILFSSNSKSSFPYNNVLTVKGAMCARAFRSVTLGLLYNRHVKNDAGDEIAQGYVPIPRKLIVSSMSALISFQ